VLHRIAFPVVSGGRGSRVIGAFALNMRVGTGRPQPVEFTLGFFRHLRYGGSLSLINVEPRRFELLTSAVQSQIHIIVDVRRCSEMPAKRPIRL
jgi:hypothetical protein